MTSNNQLNQQDRAIIEALAAEDFPLTRQAEQLERAHYLGASFGLISRIALWCLELIDDEPGHTADGWVAARLSYVPVLLRLGYSQEQVRSILEQAAFDLEGNDSGAYHQREAFWADDESVWALYTNAEELLGFVQALAEVAAEQVLKHREVLVRRLQRLLLPAIAKGSATAQDVQRLTNKVMQLAMNHLRIVETKVTYQAIMRLPIPDRIRAAKRVKGSHWGLVLKGYVLARYSLNAPDRNALLDDLYDDARRFPARMPAHYRWLCEGYRRGFRHMPELPHWTWREQLRMHWEDDLVKVFGYVAECQILPLQARPVSGGVVLEVRLDTKDGPIMLQHDPKADPSEKLKAGDRVIVCPAVVRDEWHVRAPKSTFQFGGAKGYVLRLHAADVPTRAMFDDTSRIFG